MNSGRSPPMSIYNTDYRSTPEVVNLANRVLAAAPNREDS